MGRKSVIKFDWITLRLRCMENATKESEQKHTNTWEMLS